LLNIGILKKFNKSYKNTKNYLFLYDDINIVDKTCWWWWSRGDL